MGKRAYINDGNDNWIPLVSSLPNMDAYATKDYVDINIDNLDLSTYLTINSASSTYLTQTSASTQYEKLIPYSSSAPTSPSEGDLWVDSTVPTIKAYIGSEWVSVGGGASDSDQGIISGRMFI
jgi:hypothetical protein